MLCSSLPLTGGFIGWARGISTSVASSSHWWKTVEQVGRAVAQLSVEQLEFFAALHQDPAYSCGVIGLHEAHGQERLEAAMHARQTRHSSAVYVPPSCTLWLLLGKAVSVAVACCRANVRVLCMCNSRSSKSLCIRCCLMVAGPQGPHIGRDRGLPCRSQPR